MKLCIVSDSHDRAPMLAAAVKAARDLGAQAVIHCGDLIGAMTLKPVLALGLPIHLVHGNNLGDTHALWRLALSSQGVLQYHGSDAQISFNGLRIFATHYPHYARGMACTGDFDVVCCGHEHVASIEQQAHVKGGYTWLLNPGTVAGLGGPATWMLADLDTLTFSVQSVVV